MELKEAMLKHAAIMGKNAAIFKDRDASIKRLRIACAVMFDAGLLPNTYLYDFEQSFDAAYSAERTVRGLPYYDD